MTSLWCVCKLSCGISWLDAWSSWSKQKKKKILLIDCTHMPKSCVVGLLCSTVEHDWAAKLSVCKMSIPWLPNCIFCLGKNKSILHGTLTDTLSAVLFLYWIGLYFKMANPKMPKKTLYSYLLKHTWTAYWCPGCWKCLKYALNSFLSSKPAGPNNVPT